MADAPLFEIDDLHVDNSGVDTEASRENLHGISLTVHVGEVHALIGPPGPGTSTLAGALLGSPRFAVTAGAVRFQGDDITTWGTDVRAKAGLFLAFNEPQEISGVSTLNFLQQALSARKGIEMSVRDLRLSLIEWTDRLGMDQAFVERHMNEGFSNAERQRNEILQLAVLEPEMAIVDQTGPELDIDGLAAVGSDLHTVRSERPTLGTLAITNHQRLLDHLQPTYVHVLLDGQIAASGGPELTHQLETDGYESFK